MRFAATILVALALVACTDLSKANEQYRQAMTLLAGGTEEAMQRGRDALELAAGYGSPDAALTLGYFHLRGESGFAEDASKALDLFIQAAKAGSRDAAYNAGLSYLRGHGTDVDLKRAYHWFEKAAYQGDAGAQFNVGLMKVKGDGTDPDPLMALVWFTLADEQGYEGSKEMIRATRLQVTSDQMTEFPDLLAETKAEIELPATTQGQGDANPNAPL